MNQKILIGLAVAALAAIAIAIGINHANKPRSEGGEDEARYVAPELRDHVNDVNKVIITGPDNKTVATITRSGNSWSVAEKGNFPADTGKLREFLLKLADSKLIEPKTAVKDKYATLGVDDVSVKDTKGQQIEIDGIGPPLKLIIGITNPRGGTFVRRGGDAQSWLASGTLNVDKKAEDWLRKDISDIPAARIASVSITHPDGKVVRVAKDSPADSNLKLADVPKGREAGSEFAANGLASTLGGLHFEDVVPAKDAAPGDNPLKARYVAFDGVIVEVVAWEKDGKNYAQFAASFDADHAAAFVTAEQAKEKAEYDAAVATAQKTGAIATEPVKPASVADPAKDREAKLAAMQKDVADLNARFKDWTYVLPAYKYSN
ncbi:MAG: DUF4340 domain-containing protein, partial [Rhodanobacteraceae bacterium]